MSCKFYNRFFSLLLSGTIFVLSPGCSNKGSDFSKQEKKSSISSDVYQESSVQLTNIPTINSYTCTSVCSTNSVQVSTSTFDMVYNDYDLFVLNYFNNFGNSIKDSFNSDLFLEQGKKYFVFCVDFLFYEKEINGIKFDDLSDMAKEQLLDDIINIDKLICSKFPNYKENICENSSSAYNKAFLIIEEGCNNISDFSKDKLGEDNYKKILEYKDMFVQQTINDYNEFTDILEQGKQYVKQWYEELK